MAIAPPPIPADGHGVVVTVPIALLTRDSGVLDLSDAGLCSDCVVGACLGSGDFFVTLDARKSLALAAGGEILFLGLGLLCVVAECLADIAGKIGEQNFARAIGMPE